MALTPQDLPLQQASTFWTSLRYLADGRFIIALLLLIYIPVLGPDTTSAQPFQRSLFISLTAFYMGFAVLCSVAVRRVRRGFSFQLFTQVTIDVLVLGLIVYASNRPQWSGSAADHAGGGGWPLLSHTMPALGVAAAASMILLGETTLRILQRHEMGAASIGNELMVAAFISATLFFTALVISRLARRLAMQERLAIRRGEDLRNQRAIHALVVAELDQGVIVFDPRGVPRDMNPRARRMLNLPSGTPVSQADPQTLDALRQLLASPANVADLQIRRRGESTRLRARVLTGGNIPIDELVRRHTIRMPITARAADPCWTAWCCSKTSSASRTRPSSSSWRRWGGCRRPSPTKSATRWPPSAMPGRCWVNRPTCTAAPPRSA